VRISQPSESCGTLGNVRSWDIPEYLSLVRPRNTCHVTKRYVEGGIGYPVGPRMSGTDSALSAPLRRCIHPSIFYAFYSSRGDWRHQRVTVEVLALDVCQPAIPPKRLCPRRSLHQNPKKHTSKPHFANISLTNGSMRSNVRTVASKVRSSRTEALGTVKSEVENVLEGGSVGSRTVSWFATDPHPSSVALDNLHYDVMIILNKSLSHPSLTPRSSTSPIR
jgi:hypothetical protein